MPLAKYIEHFQSMSRSKQICNIRAGTYSEEKGHLETLLKYTDDLSVVDEIRKKLGKPPIGITAVAVVEPSKVTSMGLLISLINEDYAAYETLEQEAAFRAVRIGLALERAKRMLPHGQFEGWCTENTRITKQHSWRCRKLAIEFLRQLPAKENHKFSDWIDSTDERQIEMDEPVKRFVGEKTQLDLFDEFGITGPKAKKLLPAPVKTGKNLSAADSAALLARTAWAEIVAAIDHEQQSWLNLTDHEIQQFNDVIWPVAKMMNQHVKGKS